MIDGAFATLAALFPMYMLVAMFFAASAFALSLFIKRLILDDVQSERFIAIAKKEAYVAVFISIIWVVYFAITK